MGANSAISWTDHTFNPWWGCTRVSPGCQNCYAEEWAERFGVKWGPRAERRFFGTKHWGEPLKWNRQAKIAGQRKRVFCASMADVFEDREELKPARHQLFEMIEQQSPWLDWLLLTKRPENVLRMVPPHWRDEFPRNVWMGTTAEDQEHFYRRWEHLKILPAAVRFISYEPALGPLTLRIPGVFNRTKPAGFDEWPTKRQDEAIATAARAEYVARGELPDWIIAGGESGGNRRPCEVSWFEDLAAQCLTTSIPFFMKQDAALRAGQQGRIPGELFAMKQIPETAHA